MDAPYFSFDGLTTAALCTGVYDGDTATFAFEYANVMRRFKCRMAGYNCAEIRGATPEERAKAVEARDILRSLILGKEVTLQCGQFDKYGRILVQATCAGKNINEAMLAYGKVYNGRGEKKW